MASFAKSLNIEINKNVINPNRIFSLSDSNQKLELSFHKAAPIMWQEQDIKKCAINQMTSKSELNISIDLENIVTFIRNYHDAFSLTPSKRFYRQRREFQDIIVFNNDYIMEFNFKKVINEFLDICNEYLLSLTLDKLLIVISDLNTIAIKNKLLFHHGKKIRLGDIEDQIINIMKLFFMVLETVYKDEVEDFIFKSQNINTDLLYNVDTDDLHLINDWSAGTTRVTQVLNPFQSASGKYDIPYFVHSALFATYLDIFPIVEVLVSNYFNGFYSFRPENEEKENLQLEIEKMIFQLLLFIPIFNKQGLFLSDFAVANHSFINISWALHILSDYYDASFFENIILKTFKNEIENIVVNKKGQTDDVESMINCLFYLYILSTDNANIHEKMKSIITLYQLRMS